MSLRLALCLLLFVPGTTLLAMMGAADGGIPLWIGATVGVAFGFLVGFSLEDRKDRG
jgi:hypothetical protein